MDNRLDVEPAAPPSLGHHRRAEGFGVRLTKASARQRGYVQPVTDESPVRHGGGAHLMLPRDKLVFSMLVLWVLPSLNALPRFSVVTSSRRTLFLRPHECGCCFVFNTGTEGALEQAHRQVACCSIFCIIHDPLQQHKLHRQLSRHADGWPTTRTEQGATTKKRARKHPLNPQLPGRVTASRF